MAWHPPIMITAVLNSACGMLLVAEPVSGFVNHHPTVKMPAPSFLLLVGGTSIAGGLHVHVPRGCLYFAIAFSAGIKVLNPMAVRVRARRRVVKAPG